MQNKHESPRAKEIAENNTILRTQVGSGLHGVTVANQDDRDEMGICIEPAECVIGLEAFEQYQFRTQPEGKRSGPGDLDLVIYSLRKWAKLAAQGNPTVLLMLFAPPEEIVHIDSWGRALQDSAELFLSREAGLRFGGYLQAQKERLLGERNQRTNRPELKEKYGFDCYLDDTEFLTRRGWLKYDEICQDELATISQVTGQIEFQRPTERVAKPYSGPILVHKSRYSEWAVTPNHRMWTSKMQRGSCGKNPRTYNPEQADWGFRPASEVTELDWFQQVVAVPRQGSYPVADAYLALIGAYVSEGTVAKRLSDGTPSVISMCQADGGRLHETMSLASAICNFRRYWYPARDETRKPVTIWTLADRYVALDLTKSCGIGEANKRLPSWTLRLSGRQSNVLLQALLSGDGTPYRSGGWVYYTTSERLAGDVQAVAISAGRRANVRGPYRDMYHVLIHDIGDTPYASFRGRDVREIQVENRRIVCFTVPNEILVTRRNGHVACMGNTKFAYHAIRLGIQGIEILTTGRVQLPMAEPGRTWLSQLRVGAHTLAEAVQHIEELQYILQGLAVSADLPKRANRDKIDKWLVSMYQSWWETA